MRMKEVFEAYFDDYDCIDAYMAKSFYNGNSSSFYLKDTHDRIIPLSIKSKSDLPNAYTHYELSLNGAIQIGEEYTIYDQHCRSTVVQYSHIVKVDRFNKEYTYENDDLGLTYTEEQSVFRLWAPTANKIWLVITHDNVKTSYEMVRKPKGIFEKTIHKDLWNDHYVFLVRVNGKWNQIVDPYTSFSGPNSEYSVVLDINKLDLPQKINLSPLKSNCDAIIYETSIRDMTSQPDIGVRYPKKFVGFTEENETTKAKNTGFTYIRSLGITHIQIMPVFDFGSVDEIFPNIFYNWGYDPIQFRALEGSYSVNPRDAKERVIEFANLVQNCHAAGIRVNLDLVFNHVYDKDTFALEKLVPNYYFLMNRQGDFSNGSFCGNDIDSQPPMARKYLVDTCKRIVKWFDVDGFRFDLMGILDINVMNDIATACKKLKPDFMIYGEGWNMPSFVPEGQRANLLNQAKMPYVGHFSDRFRDTVRGSNSELDQSGYASGDLSLIYSMMDRMSASGSSFDSPEKVINYVECHDNHTLWDKNKVCCHDESNEIRMKRQILANAMVLLAQGVPFLHSGQEFGRTKLGEGNSYNKSDNYNQINYNRRDQNIMIVNDTKKLIAIRKQHPCFRLKTVIQTRDQVQFQTIEDKVLVYSCFEEKDHCISFFNPSNNYYHYTTSEKVKILFDNGRCNDEYAYEISIAPYSVVVAQHCA